MIKNRKVVCETYKTYKDDMHIGVKEGELLGFFEDIGWMLQKKLLNREVIWDSYSYYIEHYWLMLKAKVFSYREEENDYSWFENFEFLYDQMKVHSKKRKVDWAERTQDQIDRFIRGEISEK